MLCRLGWHGGQLNFEADQSLTPLFDELAQHGKLRDPLIAVRRIQRPAQPRQRVQADARLEGGPHKAQPLQGSIVKQAVAARGASNRPQQSTHDCTLTPASKASRDTV